MGRTLLGAGHWNLKVMELEVSIPLPRGRYSISSMSQPSQKHHTTSPLLESLSFRFSVCTTVPQFNINKVIASHSTVSVEEASQTGSAMSVRSRLHAQLYEASCQMLQGPLPKKKKKKKRIEICKAFMCDEADIQFIYASPQSILVQHVPWIPTTLLMSDRHIILGSQCNSAACPKYQSKSLNVKISLQQFRVLSCVQLLSCWKGSFICVRTMSTVFVKMTCAGHWLWIRYWLHTAKDLLIPRPPAILFLFFIFLPKLDSMLANDVLKEWWICLAFIWLLLLFSQLVPREWLTWLLMCCTQKGN